MPAQVAGSSWPPILAWIISRPDTPRMSVATAPNWMLASSRTLAIRWATDVLSETSRALGRVRSRSGRTHCGGTKLGRRSPCWKLGDPLAIRDVGLAAGDLLD